MNTNRERKPFRGGRRQKFLHKIRIGLKNKDFKKKTFLKFEFAKKSVYKSAKVGPTNCSVSNLKNHEMDREREGGRKRETEKLE